MSHLIECTSCARHVRVEDATCPFCAASLDASARSALATAAKAPPRRRMGRAALWALGLGALSPAIIACSGDDSTTDSGIKPLYGGPPDEGDASPAPAYGLAPILDSGQEPDVHAVPAYGAPAMPIDAGADADGSEASDGGDAGDAADAR